MYRHIYKKNLKNNYQLRYKSIPFYVKYLIIVIYVDHSITELKAPNSSSDNMSFKLGSISNALL